MNVFFSLEKEENKINKNRRLMNIFFFSRKRKNKRKEKNKINKNRKLMNIFFFSRKRRN
jgi:hypothetical protein